MASWTSVKTWVSEILTSSDLNTYVRDNLEYLKGKADLIDFSGVLVDRNGATQSIPDSTYTTISFTREIIDVGGWIAVTSTTATVPASAIPAGYTTVIVDIRALVNFAANATGIRRARIMKDGSSQLSVGISAASADTTDLVLPWFATAVAGSTFTLEVYQSSGGALNVTAAHLAVTVFKPYA